MKTYYLFSGFDTQVGFTEVLTKGCISICKKEFITVKEEIMTDSAASTQ